MKVGTTTSCPRAVKSAARDADHACESGRIANLPDATPPSLTPDPLSPSSRAFNLTVNFNRPASAEKPKRFPFGRIIGRV